LKEVTPDKLAQIIGRMPTKHCSLDPAATWLVKRALPLLVSTLATIYNKSVDEGAFPED